MDTPTFVVSAVTTKDEVDELIMFIHSLIDLFPEDKRILVDALNGVSCNAQSLIGLGRFEGDPLAFFVIALDGEPSLEAIYVPPEVRNQRLGSSLFPFMAGMLHIEQIPQIRIRATRESFRFFERFGAKPSKEISPAPDKWTLMEFAPSDLRRPENWFEDYVVKNHRVASSATPDNSAMSDGAPPPAAPAARAGIVQLLRSISSAVRRFFLLAG
nr:hypothetical protein [uncultured Dongia sp.]